jgi:hypothetical protein
MILFCLFLCAVVALFLYGYEVRKEERNMIDVYVALIIGGKRTMAQVPAKYQADVRDLLLALGLDGDGNVIG